MPTWAILWLAAVAAAIYVIACSDDNNDDMPGW
jgi:hypothetical protein